MFVKHPARDCYYSFAGGPHSKNIETFCLLNMGDGLNLDEPCCQNLAHITGGTHAMQCTTNIIFGGLSAHIGDPSRLSTESQASLATECILMADD